MDSQQFWLNTNITHETDWASNNKTQKQKIFFIQKLDLKLNEKVDADLF